MVGVVAAVVVALVLVVVCWWWSCWWCRVGGGGGAAAAAAGCGGGGRGGGGRGGGGGVVEVVVFGLKLVATWEVGNQLAAPHPWRFQVVATRLQQAEHDLKAQGHSVVLVSRMVWDNHQAFQASAHGVGN